MLFVLILAVAPEVAEDRNLVGTQEVIEGGDYWRPPFAMAGDRNYDQFIAHLVDVLWRP
jgi:hypothetical protein